MNQIVNETVSKVVDGDTFETRTGTKPYRLADVDTPERGEAGYEEAKDALTRLINGKQVKIETLTTDKYNRYVANVWVASIDVNKAMQKYSK